MYPRIMSLIFSWFRAYGSNIPEPSQQAILFSILNTQVRTRWILFWIYLSPFKKDNLGLLTGFSVFNHNATRLRVILDFDGLYIKNYSTYSIFFFIPKYMTTNSTITIDITVFLKSIPWELGREMDVSGRASAILDAILNSQVSTKGIHGDF